MEKSILRAAMQLLEKHGPEGLTTRAVCDAVEITAPTLYYHFDDKRGLLDAVVAGQKSFACDLEAHLVRVSPSRIPQIPQVGTDFSDSRRRSRSSMVCWSSVWARIQKLFEWQ